MAELNLTRADFIFACRQDREKFCFNENVFVFSGINACLFNLQIEKCSFKYKF